MTSLNGQQNGIKKFIFISVTNGFLRHPLNNGIDYHQFVTGSAVFCYDLTSDLQGALDPLVLPAARTG